MSRLDEIAGRKVSICDSSLDYHQKENQKYLLELDLDKLLVPHKMEAGRFKTNDLPVSVYEGWEAPTCQLRGHFIGHWMSACAMNYSMTGDKRIQAAAETAVDELEQCQLVNGGRWAASIPEKYLYWIAKGIEVWAPQYTIHKTFMGLLDIYTMIGYGKALEIADRFGEWFYEWSGKFTREEFQKILGVETGGMLEIWAILYRITGKNIYAVLMERYYHEALFDGLLQGRDVLTNMHENTMLPEILGAAAVYEVTGDEKYMKIVREFWRQGVTERGYYATGGQSCGEVWTPKQHLNTRLGNKTQEHCTVYNMMRIASFLFCYEKDSAYMDYWERNLYNGILAQSYWNGFHVNVARTQYPTTGFMTYFLPMRAGSRKAWRGKFEHFFCCHGSVVQANAALNRGLYYRDEGSVYVCQYLDSDCKDLVHGKELSLRQRQRMHQECCGYADKPEFMEAAFQIEYEGKEEVEICFRIPEWCRGKYTVQLNDESLKLQPEHGFVRIKRNWSTDQVVLVFERKIHAEKLPGDEHMVAFLDGPEVLAGLIKEEQALYGDPEHPEDLIVPECDREWERWISNYRTKGQENDIRFLPIRQVGYEKYQIYFQIEQKGMA